MPAELQLSSLFTNKTDPGSRMNKSIGYCLLLHDNLRQMHRPRPASYDRFDRFRRMAGDIAPNNGGIR